jgi:predicted TIM-barrel fold metal-dependent hydrolase
MRLSASDLLNKTIDCHTHCVGIDASNLFKGRYPCTQDILDLSKKMIEGRVDYAITFPMPTTLYYNVRTYWEKGEFVPSGISDYPYQLENRYMVQSITHFNLNNMLPFAIFSLRDKVNLQLAGINKLMEQYEIYGLKYHTKVDQKKATDIEKDSEFIEFAKEKNIPIMLHAENKTVSDPMYILELASRHTNVRFCAAHFAGFSKQFFNELNSYEYDNVYFDACPLIIRCKHLSYEQDRSRILDLDYSDYRGVFNYFCETYSSRILWGTDAPWNYYAKLDSTMNDSVVCYQQEADIIANCSQKLQLSNNSIRYIFG